MATGDITYSHVDPLSPFASGTLVCDADVAANILCGFQPSRIELFYKDADDTGDLQLIWFKGMAAGSYWKITVAGASTLETSGGPTVYAGLPEGLDVDGEAQSSATEGFTVPAGLQATDDDVIYWYVQR